MPRKTTVPKYLLHKGSGQAYTYHRLIATPDHRIYLGSHGSIESQQKYHEVLRWVATQVHNQLPPALPQSQTPTLYELALEYDLYARQHYATDDGVSREYVAMWGALQYMLNQHGAKFASVVGPRLLKDIQRWMVAEGFARTHINHTTSRLKRFFRWAAAEERIDPTVYHKLLCVGGLRCGEMGARDSTPIAPVKVSLVQSLLPFVSPVVGDMMQVQYLCAMRPIETCIMRPADIDRSGDIWLYRPTRHKTKWAGKQLVKAIPRAAQAILAPRLNGDAKAFMFTPAESIAWQHEQRRKRREERTTPIYPSEIERVAKRGEERARRPRVRPIGQRYCTDSYRRAIWYGVKQAAAANVAVERFSPNQLRHAIVTFVAERLGQQKAQRYAGHENLDTTSMYTEKNIGEMIDVARQLDELWAIDP